MTKATQLLGSYMASFTFGWAMLPQPNRFLYAATASLTSNDEIVFKELPAK